MESKQPGDWKASPILKGIRDYNEDDCRSTAELLQWLRKVAADHHIIPAAAASVASAPEPKEVPPEALARLDTAAKLRKQGDPVSVVLADLVDFHRREAKPIWWRMFDRAEATPDELRDDPGCIEGIHAIGSPVPERRSLIQTYSFDPSQECKLAAGDDSKVMFTHNLEAKFTVVDLDANTGDLALKISIAKLTDAFGGAFPQDGSLLADEYVSPAGIPDALTAVAAGQLTGRLHPPVAALLTRTAPAAQLQAPGESVKDAAIRITRTMRGGCLVVQGPPGTGKTYTASRVIDALLRAGKRVGVSSNSHKAIVNLLSACGEAARESARLLQGIKVGGEAEGPLFSENRGLRHIE